MDTQGERWEEMTNSERNALVAEWVMGWRTIVRNGTAENWEQAWNALNDADEDPVALVVYPHRVMIGYTAAQLEDGSLELWSPATGPAAAYAMQERIHERGLSTVYADELARFVLWPGVRHREAWFAFAHASPDHRAHAAVRACGLDV